MRQCLFCDETKLTREHVWPDWIVELFNQERAPKRDLYTATHHRADGLEIVRPANDITLKSKQVCLSCNTGWMSDIEGLSQTILKPMILTHGPKRLTLMDQCTLAVWVNLRAMVWDAVENENHRYFSQSDRVAFSESDPFQPPTNCHVWLASYAHKPRHNYATFVVRNYINTTKDTGAQCISFVMNHLVGQVMNWKGRIDRAIPFNSLKQQGWNRATKLVWPSPRNVVVWPPDEDLDGQAFDALVDRWDLRR